MHSYSRADERAVSELLDREWDPIGVYQGPIDAQAPPGEYSTYASWILYALLSGGGKSEVRRRMNEARERMGLTRSRRHDDRTADLLVEWWNQRANG